MDHASSCLALFAMIVQIKFTPWHKPVYYGVPVLFRQTRFVNQFELRIRYYCPAINISS